MALKDVNLAEDVLTLALKKLHYECKGRSCYQFCRAKYILEELLEQVRQRHLTPLIIEAALL